MRRTLCSKIQKVGHSGLGGIHNIGKNCVGERMMCLEKSVTLGALKEVWH